MTDRGDRAEKNDDELTPGDAELIVRQSHEGLAAFDPRRIADALTRETGISAERAREIASGVQEQIGRLGIKNLTSPLIRGLVNARLIEEGLLDAYRAHSRLGVPIYDVSRIIQSLPGTGEESDRPLLHGPEGTSLSLAAAIKREYAMLSVFSEKVSYAHLDGDLHIGNTGEVDRPQAMICSIDYIKRHGVKLPGGFAGSRPARRPEVLASHLVTWTAALQGYFSEALTWDSVNFGFAPMLTGLSQREVRQLAQGLLFELSAPTIARGGQPIRCDLHLDWDAPPYIDQLPMVGSAGEQYIATYGTVAETARNFLRIFFETYLEGDANGRPFSGPRPILHLRPSFLNHPDHRRFIDLLEEVMSERGGLSIIFDQPAGASGESSTLAPASPIEEAFTSRYGLGGEKLRRAGEQWQWRAAVLSSIGLNLPRIGYRAEGFRHRIPELLTELLEVAAQASLEKRIFLEKLLARGEEGSLALLAMRPAEEAFLSLSWSSHAICPLGLAEMVQIVTGESLAASLDAQELALQIVGHLRDEIDRLSTTHKVRFILAEARDTIATRRLAQLDRRKFGLTGLTGEGAFVPVLDPLPERYTPGVKLPAGGLEPGQRLRIEGLLLGRRVWNGVVNLDRNERLNGLVAAVLPDATVSGISID